MIDPYERDYAWNLHDRSKGIYLAVIGKNDDGLVVRLSSGATKTIRFGQIGAGKRYEEM